MKTLTIIAAAIAGLALVIDLGWLLTANNLAMTAFFGPRAEAVRRNTFGQSKAYRQGAVQELQNMQFDYVRADPAHRAALRSLILHRAVDVPADAMPADLANFISGLKDE